MIVCIQPNVFCAQHLLGAGVMQLQALGSQSQPPPVKGFLQTSGMTKAIDARMTNQQVKTNWKSSLLQTRLENHQNMTCFFRKNSDC